MSAITPFQRLSQSAIITCGVAAQSTPLLLAGGANLNLGSGQPTQVRLLNKGTADIWFSFTAPAANGAIAIPTAGTTTIGTPQPAQWAAPGIEISLSLECGWQLLQGLPGNAAPAIGVWLNTIAGAAACPLYLVFGEGL